MAIEIRGLAPYPEVFDMPTSLKFYRDKLGFEVVASDNQTGEPVNWVLLRLNGSELMLNTQHELSKRPPAPDAARRAAHRDTTLYFGAPDVEAAYEHLRAQGVEVEKPKLTQYGLYAIWLKDPDGYGLCFHWPKT